MMRFPFLLVGLMVVARPVIMPDDVLKAALDAVDGDQETHEWISIEEVFSDELRGRCNVDFLQASNGLSSKKRVVLVRLKARQLPSEITCVVVSVDDQPKPLGAK